MSLTDQQFFWLLNIAAIWWLLPAFVYAFEVRAVRRFRFSWYLCILFLSWPALLGFLLKADLQRDD